MENQNSTLSVRSAKPLINVTFWAPFFDQNRRNAIFHFWDEKAKFCLFSTSGALFAQKTPRNGKMSPKVRKAHLRVLGSKNVPRCLRFKGSGASGEKLDFSIFTLFGDFLLFGRKSRFWRPKAEKSPKNRIIRSFSLFCENGSHND